MLTLENMPVGTIITDGQYFIRILARLNDGENSVFLTSFSNDEPFGKELTRCCEWVTLRELAHARYTIHERELDVAIEINGKKYLKEAVINKLSELEEVE